MSHSILRHRSATLIAASLIALVSGCDRESPTDVATPTVRVTPVAPSLAVTQGKPSTSSYEIRTSGSDVGSGTLGVLEVLCPAGKRALGGGHKVGGGALIDGPDVAVYESTPRVTTGTDGWRLEAMNRTADTRHIDVWVVCAAI